VDVVLPAAFRIGIEVLGDPEDTHSTTTRSPLNFNVTMDVASISKTTDPRNLLVD